MHTRDLTIKGLQDMFATFALDNTLKISISKPCNALSFLPNLKVVNKINSIHRLVLTNSSSRSCEREQFTPLPSSLIIDFNQNHSP